MTKAGFRLGKSRLHHNWLAISTKSGSRGVCLNIYRMKRRLRVRSSGGGTGLLFLFPFFAFWIPDFYRAANMRLRDRSLGRALLKIWTSENASNSRSDRLRAALVLLWWPLVVLFILMLGALRAGYIAETLDNIYACRLPVSLIGFWTLGGLVIWAKPTPGEHLEVRERGICYRGHLIPVESINHLDLEQGGTLKLSWSISSPQCGQTIQCRIPRSFVESVARSLEQMSPEASKRSDEYDGS